MSQSGPVSRVLVIGPDPRERHATAACLQRAGCEVTEGDGQGDPIDRGTIRRIDVVVVCAPELVGQVREVAAARFVAVLLVVGAAELDAACASSTADDFLLRPLREVELRARVRALCGLKRSRDERREQMHQIKNPLSAILANCQYLIRFGALRKEERDVIGDVERSAGELHRLIDIYRGSTGSYPQAGSTNAPVGRANR